MAQQEGFETQTVSKTPTSYTYCRHMPKHTRCIQNQQTNEKKTKKKAHKEATEEDILTPTSLPCMPA